MPYSMRNQQPMASSSAAQRAESPSDSEYAEDISDSAPNKFKLSQRSFMRMIRQREAQLDAAATAEKYKSKRANKMGNIFSNKITSNTNSYKFTQFRIPVDGWRKKCLFLLMLVLFILIGINMALTLWIIKVMEFSSEGMGQFKVVDGGLQLTGLTSIFGVLSASTFRSRYGKPISIESSENFTVNTRDSEGFVDNQLILDDGKLEVLAKTFQVLDPNGDSLFSVDEHDVTIGAKALKIDGDEGAIFQEAIQTPLVQTEAENDLKLESPTRSLDVGASQEIFFKSQSGGIDASCLANLKLQSTAGTIRLDAENIMMPTLKTAQPLQPDQLPRRNRRIYQLCVCGIDGANNGKLFLASPDGICDTDDSSLCK